MIKYINILILNTILLFSLSACDVINEKNTLWDAAKIAGKKTGIKNQEKVYVESGIVAPLKIPKDIKPVEINEYYAVPTVNNRATVLSRSMLPPGSLTAHKYLKTKDAKNLIKKKVQHIQILTREYGGAGMEINANFAEAWQLIGLALVQSDLMLIKANEEKGIYFINDPAMQTQGKKAVFLVLVRSDKNKSVITVLNEKQENAKKQVAQQIIAELSKQMLNFNRGNQHQPLLGVKTRDVYGHYALMLNRAGTNIWDILPHKFAVAGYTVLKQNRQKSYFMVMSPNKIGVIKAKQPIYVVYVQDKGVYSLIYIATSDGQLASLKLSNLIYSQLQQTFKGSQHG